MRRLLLLAILLLPSARASAQGLSSSALIAAPNYTQFKFGTGTDARTVSQLAVPIVLILPFAERFSMDVATAFADSKVEANGTTASAINGLTDTQIRANLTLGSDAVVVTLGLNLPTGQYTVPEGQQEAAGQIGNDFLNYTISSMGNGLAGTGGLAVAKSLGAWNFAVAGSFRRSTEFAAFSVASRDYRFTPADEYRVRVGADREIGTARLSIGVAYSAFGEDFADSTSYSTGDRVIANGALQFALGSTDVILSGWNLYRLEGQQVGGDAPAENVSNANLTLGWSLGNVLVQPNIEGRFWQVAGARAGQLANAGIRFRFQAGPLSFYPSAGYSLGKLYSISDGSATDVSGYRGALTIRIN